MIEFIKKLTQLITNLELGKVTEELNKLFTVANPSLETDIILIEANRKQLDVQQNRNIISGDEYRRELNKILNRLLNLIEEIKNNISQYLPYISGEHINGDAIKKDIILFFGANPGKINNIDIRKEVKQISEKLKMFNKRDSFEFKIKLDIKASEFQRSFLDLEREPRFFHFGGNAFHNDPVYGSGIVLVGDSPDEPIVVDGDILVSIFSRFKNVECVFLNACNTMSVGISISKHIPYVITMNQYTMDNFAIDFASKFYEGIGAGFDIEKAFGYSIDELKIIKKYKKEQIETPQLLIKGNGYKCDNYNETFSEWKRRVNPN